MNKFSLFTILVTLLLNLSATEVFAMKVANDDGVVISYTWTIKDESRKDRTELEVVSTSWKDEDYSGNLVIPEFVAYQGKLLIVTSIGVMAFQDCNELISVKIPNTVTKICKSAFYRCNNLSSINIPNSVTSIDENAFSACKSLTMVTIPKYVTSIGNMVFEYCESLTDVYCYAENVPKISYHTFPYSLKESLILHVPSSVIEKYKSDSYWKNQFKDIVALDANDDPDEFVQDGIEYKRLSPDMLEIIGASKASTNLNIPEAVTYNGATYSVTSIGAGAFCGCNKLTSVTIPPNVTNIGIGAFYKCSSLTSVNIPKSVTSISNYAFAYCNGLTSIVVEEGHPMYDSRDNCNAIIETSSNTLVLGFNCTVIPNSVTSIGERAFYGCSGLTSINIPNSVTSIGVEAFEGCSGLSTAEFHCTEICSWFSGLKSINTILIGDEVTSIGDSAFRFCSGLTSVTIPKNVESIATYAFQGCDNLSTVEYHCLEIGDWLNRLKSIKDVIIGEEVTSIGFNAFRKCSGLTSVTIPNSVTSIGESAFLDCSGLTSVTIGSSVTSIGRDAFSGCINLVSVITQNGVTSIGYAAFSGCKSLTNLTIPQSVTSIGNFAFSGCSSLTSITIPSSVTSIGYSAFVNCKNLISVTIFNSMTSTSIDRNVFNRCENLSTIEFHCPEINDWFSGIRSLTSIIFGDEVTTIGNFAFEKCSSLTAVIIPNSVTTIGKYAFSDCYNLISVTIPNSVTSIDKYAFSGCNSLQSIISEIEKPFIIPRNVFNEDLSNIQLTVPEGTLTAYQATEGWNSFTNIVERSYINGDANGDGDVDEADVNAIANHIIGKTLAGFDVKAADINNDGKVNAADIVALVNMIRNK